VKSLFAGAANASLLLLTGTLLAGLYALGKVAAAAGATPAAILLWQVGGGAAGLGCLSLARGVRPPVSSAHLRYYLVSGVLGVSAPNALVYVAVQTVDLGVVALATALSALFTYAGALLLDMERFASARFAGCVLGLAGVLALLAPRDVLDAGADPRGLLAAVGAPLLLAAGNLYRTRAWPQGTPPLALATGMLSLQLPLLAFAAALGGVAAGGGATTAGALPSLAALAAAAPLVYAAHFTLQHRGGPVYVSQLGYVMTIAGAVLGYQFFGERYGLRAGLAAALVLGGVLLVNRGSRPG